MSRTNPVSVYMSAADRQRLETEADERHMSLSGYIMWIIEQHWQNEDVEAKANRANVEERVENMVAEARDDLEEIAENIEQWNDAIADAVMTGGTYSAATWELVKQDVPDPERQQYLSTGSRRLREPLDADIEESDLESETDPDPDDGGGGFGRQWLKDRRENDDIDET